MENSQYSRRECLELIAYLKLLKIRIWKGQCLAFLKKLDVMVDPSNTEDCHSIKSSKGSKNIILNLFRGKNAI